MDHMNQSLSPLSDRSSSNCSSELEQLEANLKGQAIEDDWFETEMSPDWEDLDSWPSNEGCLTDQQRLSINQAQSQPSDPDQLLDKDEYYKRYHWDAPQFVFEGDMDAICNTMNGHFQIDMEAQRAAKDRLKRHGYPHFKREEDTLFNPMPTSNRLHHHKHGQFDDAEEKLAASLKGNTYRARNRRCRMAPY